MTDIVELPTPLQLAPRSDEENEQEMMLPPYQIHLDKTEKLVGQWTDSLAFDDDF